MSSRSRSRPRFPDRLGDGGSVFRPRSLRAPLAAVVGGVLGERDGFAVLEVGPRVRPRFLNWRGGRRDGDGGRRLRGDRQRAAVRLVRSVRRRRAGWAVPRPSPSARSTRSAACPPAASDTSASRRRSAAGSASAPTARGRPSRRPALVTGRPGSSPSSAHHRHQLRGHVWAVVGDRLGRLGLVPDQLLGDRPLGERRVAGQQEVEGGAQAVDVGPDVHAVLSSACSGAR